MSYDREKAAAYARRWALKRNPAYYNFDGIGGDCTNFVSQCLFAGCGTMNYTKDVGWYFNSVNDRAAAWSGVEFLYKFLMSNKGPGPSASERPIKSAEVGDIIQLSYDGVHFGHSTFVTEVSPEILLAHHSAINAYGKPFSQYMYMKARLLHIEKA